MRELLTEQELYAEGTAQRHCVAAYVNRCATGRSAIFQLSCNGLRRLTIEVDPSRRLVVQVKARFNALPNEMEMHVVRQWAECFSLFVGMGRP
jgi:hypothetical protein